MIDEDKQQEVSPELRDLSEQVSELKTKWRVKDNQERAKKFCKENNIPEMMLEFLPYEDTEKLNEKLAKLSGKDPKWKYY